MQQPILRPHQFVALAALLASAACAGGGGGGGGGGTTPIGDANVAPEVIACRRRVDDPFKFAEIAIRNSRNLGTHRVSDRAGLELHARMHPDGNRVVFARERSSGALTSREIYLSSLDGSFAELRLTNNNGLDDDPSWSPDGEHILFTSDQFGVVGLWTMNADGTNARQFLVPPAGSADGEAEWNATTHRVVWTRTDQNDHRRLWIANENGTGSMPLTSEVSGDDTVDRAPSFSPDGSRVVFVRRIDADHAKLCYCDVATGHVDTMLAPNGDVGTPRFAPTMDRLLFGLAEPAAGRATLRLASMPINGGTPTLVWPDQLWELVGLDLMPAFPSAPVGTAPVVLDDNKAVLEILAGSSFFGDKSQLTSVDGQEVLVQTTAFNLREIAGINCRFGLPIADPEDALEFHIRAVARTSRADSGAVLRLTIYNPVENRFDIAVEMHPTGTGPQQMSFTSNSLRHVSREKQVQVSVIADLPNGNHADFHVDLLEVEMIAKPQPPQ